MSYYFSRKFSLENEAARLFGVFFVGTLDIQLFYVLPLLALVDRVKNGIGQTVGESFEHERAGNQ